MDNYLQQWKDIVEAKDIHYALFNHFQYLVDTPGFETVLKAIMDEAFEVSYTNEHLLIRFSGNEKLYASVPMQEIPEAYPTGYREKLAQHELLGLENAMLSLGEHGEGLFESIEDSVLTEIVSSDQIVSPIWDYSDCWLYHPAEKNIFGEPMLYYFSHEGGDIFRPQPYNAGSLFLKRCAEKLNLKVKTPKTISTTDAASWWSGLDDAWKQLLSNELKIDCAEEAQRIITIKDLYIDKYSRITTLEPITIMEKLGTLYCDAQAISDISALKSLPNLRELRLSSKNISDLSPIAHLTSIENLSLSHVQTLEPLSYLTNLQCLNISDTQIKDITALSNCKKLHNLDIARTNVSDLSSLSALKNLKKLNISNTRVTEFEFLSSLERLGSFEANNTALSSLKALESCKGLYILSCRNTTVSFKDFLHISAYFTEINSSTLDSLTIYSDYNHSPYSFIKAVEKIDFALDGMAEILTLLINNYLISILENEEDKYQADRLLRAYFNPTIINYSSSNCEEIAANALVGILSGHVFNEVAEKVFQQLVPDTVTLPRLAFNLACYYAVKDNKTLLLKYTALSLQKGYNPEKFRREVDFGSFQHDADFKQMLDKPSLPEPENDPLGWWDSLPDSLKEILAYQINDVTPEEIQKLLHKDIALYYPDARNLDPLKYLKGLKKVTLNFCRVETLNPLASIQSLESLECEGSCYAKAIGSVQYSDLGPLEGLKNLTDIRLKEHLISDISPLRNLTKLKILKLWGNPIESLEALRELNNLETLIVTLRSGMYIDVTVFRNLVNLDYLSISSIDNNPIQVASLGGIQNLKKLTRLSLYDLISENGSPLSLEPLSHLEKLESLWIKGLLVDNLEYLYQLKNLHSLSIENLNDTWKSAIKMNMPWCKIA